MCVVARCPLSDALKPDEIALVSTERKVVVYLGDGPENAATCACSRSKTRARRAQEAFILPSTERRQASPFLSK